MLAPITIWVPLGPASPSNANQTLTVFMEGATVTDLRHSFESLVLIVLCWIVAASSMLIARAREQTLRRGLATGQVWHASHCEIFRRHSFAVMDGRDTQAQQE